MYEVYVSRSVVGRSLVIPHVRHMYVLLPILMPYIRHVLLVLHIGVNLKVKTTHIWSFGCSFAYATTIGCDVFKLSFGINIVLLLLIIIK